MAELESFIIDQLGVIRGTVCRSGEWAGFDGLQTMPKWIDVMSKMADPQPSDHEAKRGL